MNPNHSRGFTLVEVLVAMVIMAIMALMAWQGVDGIIRARDASQARLERTLRLNTVIAQWDQDLAQVQEEKLVVNKAIVCSGNSVRITRRTPTGLQFVVWSLRPSDDNTSSTLVRWAGPPATTLDALSESFRDQQSRGPGSSTVEAINGLSSWKVYFFKETAWTNCGSSVDDLPGGVRLVLTFAPGSGLSGDLTRDTLLPAKR